MDDRFDPQEEEGRRSTGLITKRDAIIIGAALVVFGTLMYPFFVNMMEQRNKYVCTDNLSKIVKAINVYAEDNSGRLPPAYMSDEDYKPLNVRDGKIYSWASLLATSIDKKDVFQCPSAKPEELVKNDDGKGGLFYTAYGLFAPLSAAPIDSIANPSQTVLIGETAASGARKTLNPSPMFGDGIVIGFDNSNFSPLDQANVFEASKSASRLAFYETAGGDFKIDGPSRHPGGNHFLYVDGHIDTHKPSYAVIRRTGKKNGEILGGWAFR